MISIRTLVTLAALAAAVGAGPAQAGGNLVVNGSFDNPDDPLAGWKYRYDLPGESWYFQNHEHVKVVPVESGRRSVLALWGNEAILQVPGQGTVVDSKPIAVKPGARYKLTASARTSGPDCRILVEGYKWAPGVKPHADPELHELRKCYKAREIYFGPVKAGTSGGVGKSWQTESQTFPKEGGSDLALDSWKKAEFLVIHIVAIKGSEGTLYVDDVKLEQID